MEDVERVERTGLSEGGDQEGLEKDEKTGFERIGVHGCLFEGIEASESEDKRVPSDGLVAREGWRR